MRSPCNLVPSTTHLIRRQLPLESFDLGLKFTLCSTGRALLSLRLALLLNLPFRQGEGGVRGNRERPALAPFAVAFATAAPGAPGEIVSEPAEPTIPALPAATSTTTA